MLKPYQKWTVFTPTGLFHIFWKVLCCSPAAALASVLWNRNPLLWLRTFCPKLRKAARELARNRRPTRDDDMVVLYCNVYFFFFGRGRKWDGLAKIWMNWMVSPKEWRLWTTEASLDSLSEWVSEWESYTLNADGTIEVSWGELGKPERRRERKSWSGNCKCKTAESHRHRLRCS